MSDLWRITAGSMFSNQFDTLFAKRPTWESCPAARPNPQSRIELNADHTCNSRCKGSTANRIKLIFLSAIEVPRLGINQNVTRSDPSRLQSQLLSTSVRLCDQPAEIRLAAIQSFADLFQLYSPPNTHNGILSYHPSMA